MDPPPAPPAPEPTAGTVRTAARTGQDRTDRVWHPGSPGASTTGWAGEGSQVAAARGFDAARSRVLRRGHHRTQRPAPGARRVDRTAATPAGIVSAAGRGPAERHPNQQLEDATGPPGRACGHRPVHGEHLPDRGRADLAFAHVGGVGHRRSPDPHRLHFAAGPLRQPAAAASPGPQTTMKRPTEQVRLRRRCGAGGRLRRCATDRTGGMGWG